MITSTRRRPSWITRNKILIALHLMSDDVGVIIASTAQIARAARIGWRGVRTMLKGLEERGELFIVDPDAKPWTIILADSPTGIKFAAFLDALDEALAEPPECNT